MSESGERCPSPLLQGYPYLGMHPPTTLRRADFFNLVKAVQVFGDTGLHQILLAKVGKSILFGHRACHLPSLPRWLLLSASLGVDTSGHTTCRHRPHSQDGLLIVSQDLL